MLLSSVKAVLKRNKHIVELYRKYYANKSGKKHIAEAIEIINRGINPEAKIFQISHRLERGICLCRSGSEKKSWGFNKANELVDLLIKQKAINNNDSVKIGIAALSVYIKEKEKCVNEDEMRNLLALKNKISNSGITLALDEQFAGVRKLTKKDLLHGVDNFENLFFSRHSIREFSDKPVDKKLLEKAIELAWTSPSSCNRQATEIYVLDGKNKEIAVRENNMNADKFLIICGKMDYFPLEEINDWIVSTSIFCGYLSLALHSVGIAHCLIRKSIIYESSYNKELKKVLRIPDNQKIILEVAIGNYKDDFVVPVSKRRSIKEVLHYSEGTLLN